METRPAVETGQAAYYLGRRSQTLRAWSSSGRGPIQPVRVYGRLMWSVRDIRRLLGLEGDK
nr:DNA-binding protein [Tepidimonas sediminis]